MKVFRDLEIDFGGKTEAEIIEKLGMRLSADWSRDLEAEEELASRFGAVAAYGRYAYNLNEDGGGTARVWVAVDESSGKVFVLNIVPLGESRFSYEEYNSILAAFAGLLSKDPEIKCSITEAAEIPIERFTLEEKFQGWFTIDD